MIKALSGNPEHIQHLCSRLDIGSQQRQLCRVYGGFHHKMWRLETDRGTYAIKQLSADTDLSQADSANHYNVTEAVAETFAGHGISAIFALKRNTQYLQVIENIGYLVYPWTNAVALDIGDISEKHACEIARVLAKMHCANISVPGLKDVRFDIHPEDKIISLVKRAGECNVRKSNVLNEQLPTFLSIVDTQKTAVQILEKHAVISHGDLDHKNVLWSDADTPILIDWESARNLNPTYETLLEALDWSGITVKFDYSLFKKIISSYREAGGVIEGSSLQASFDCILGDWVNWLMYNVGRAIDLADEEQRSIGIAQVDLSLATIARLRDLMPKLVNR